MRTLILIMVKAGIIASSSIENLKQLYEEKKHQKLQELLEMISADKAAVCEYKLLPEIFK